MEPIEWKSITSSVLRDFWTKCSICSILPIILYSLSVKGRPFGSLVVFLASSSCDPWREFFPTRCWSMALMSSLNWSWLVTIVFRSWPVFMGLQISGFSCSFAMVELEVTELWGVVWIRSSWRGLVNELCGGLGGELYMGLKGWNWGLIFEWMDSSVVTELWCDSRLMGLESS